MKCHIRLLIASDTIQKVIITLINPKGGTGKSTSSIHLAGIFSEKYSTVLVDLDEENRSCLDYLEGGNLSFTGGNADDFDLDLKHRGFEVTVVDAYARPTSEQLKMMASLSDIILIPTPPDAVSLRVLARFIPEIEATEVPYRVVLTMVPPKPSTEADKARKDLRGGDVPVLKTQIPRSIGFARGARQQRLAYELPGYSRLRRPFVQLRREIENVYKKEV